MPKKLPTLNIDRPTKLPEPVKALSPATIKRELDSLEYLYEHTEISNEAYDSAKAKLFKSLEEWGKQ